MMALLVLAYPQLASEDYNQIQRYRKDNDELFYHVVEPHFTIVFPAFDLPQTDFVEEIREKAQDVPKFDFTIRCATINKDSFSDYFHVFLVPDEGYSRIVRLHDQLYSGKLFDNLRLDIDFVPHIGIANAADKLRCKKMVDAWNAADFAISGTISTLTIVTYENDTVETIEEVQLQSAA
jgi:hypothetical protein